MEKPMKRKQFHLTNEDEEILKYIAKTKRMSEAEIVREAIREYAAKNAEEKNPLFDMAIGAERDFADTPVDLSVNHDNYLLEKYTDGKK
ncbi:ribbon-helix-helix protein, CopG family [Paucisalibacillus globulus]|uniref:ribbon-helix-helix protein, CopG family n=1 Tax=Paucisalibacillus globulus TaxID=351095 RepID=UPI0004218944|nr:ribbon-helix-helix protein, CopG family [Paucisalibacillus globulus]